jgi:flagellar basal body rod protein FlgG
MDLMQIASASLLTDRDRLNLIANNLANAATAGYKRSIAVQDQGFAISIKQALATASPAAQASPLRAVLDFADGALRSTRRSLDITVGSDVFLELRTPTGLVYSRGGSFVVDAQGCVVLGEATLQLQDGDFKLTDPALPVSIDSTGAVRSGDRQLGALRLVQFDDVSRLQILGNGLYAPGLAQMTDSTKAPSVRSGFLETSNVQPAQEMIKLMETTRHFEAMQKVVQTYDESIGTAVRTLGGF